MKDKKVIKDEFQKNGYVFIPGFLSIEEVEKIIPKLGKPANLMSTHW